MNAMIEADLVPPEHLYLDGKIYRFGPKNSCWYVALGDGVPAGRFGDWKLGLDVTWRAEVDRGLTTKAKVIIAHNDESGTGQRYADEAAKKYGAPVSSAILVAGAAPVKVSKADEKLKYAERAFQNMFALGGQIVVSGMPIVKYSAAETWFLQDGKAESTAKSYATNKLKAGVLNLLQDSKLIKKNELQGGWEPTSEDLKSRLLTGIVT